jgi:hypothetical protein
MAGENFKPTLDELSRAEAVYGEKAGDNANYQRQVATIDRIMSYNQPGFELQIAESLLRILADWNNLSFNVYKHKPLQSDIEDAIKLHWPQITAVKPRSIESLSESDMELIAELYQAFKGIPKMGDSNTGICLHLLAPNFFPSWSKNITEAYGLGDKLSMKVYWAFMHEVRNRLKVAYKGESIEPGSLRKLDKFNFSRSKGWM